MHAVSAAVVGAAGDDGAWRWPVPLDPAVSSNFCEYRDGRFHAGLDVRTFGREGVPCLAVADGWVSRMRASSRGYGRALHLTLDSGMQVVYAHLAEFAPALEDTLRATQARDTAYTVDFRLPPNRFRVGAGDVIAYSGTTGTTAPHLHLEVRDSVDAPVNPFVHGLPVPDRLRPALTRVVFVPLEAGASVNGSLVPLETKPRRRGDGHYELADTLRIRGAVGVALTSVDRANAESGSLAPYDLLVTRDDSLAARVTLERFTFDRADDVDLFYSAAAIRARGVVLYQLFTPHGAEAGLGEFTRGGALVAAPDRAHSARVVVTDVAGNWCDLSFIYKLDDTSSSRPVRGFRRDLLALDLDGAYFGGDFAVIPLGPPPLRHRSDDIAERPTVVVRATDVGGLVRPLAAYADRDTAVVYVAGVHASQPESVVVPALGLAVDLPAGALYGDAVLYVRGVDAPDKSGRELVRRTRAVRVGPVGLVLRKDATVRLGVETPTEKDAIYRRDGSNGWSYLASRPDSGGVLSTTTGRPGVFAVFRDETAPRLGSPRQRAAVSYATGAVVQELDIPVDDAGSGFDESRLRVWVGGRRRVTRWDFLAKKVVVSLDGEPIIGSQPVRVVAFDRIGNSSVLDTTIEIDAR
jgi:murein DD-endopeptidase MepM/ murein hydrolase activator NlpD